MQTKNILILGGSSGIGAGLSEFYHQNGAQVYVGARRIETIERSNLKLKAFYFDIDQLDKIETKLEEQASKIGNIDLIINCIGIGEINKDLDAEIDLSIIQTNVAGFTVVSNWCFRHFQKQGYGHYVAISSIAGIRGAKDSLVYNASKAFQINFLEGLQQKAKQTKLPIYITDIRPGLVDTKMAKGEGLFWVMPVSKVVRQIARSIQRKKHLQYVTKRWGVLAFILKRIPRFIYNRI